MQMKKKLHAFKKTQKKGGKWISLHKGLIS